MERFDLGEAPTDQKVLTILECYKVVPYGYVRSFAHTYTSYVLQDENGVLSTILASTIKEKHWKNPEDG